MAESTISVGAVVLAAGIASRMGRSKLDLDWPTGDSVLGRVLDVLILGGADHLVVVTGGHRDIDYLLDTFSQVDKSAPGYAHMVTWCSALMPPRHDIKSMSARFLEYRSDFLPVF